MKKYTHKEQIKYAKRWLETLKTTKRVKTTSVLRYENIKDQFYNPKLPKFSYCCLGIGCQLYKIIPKKWSDTSNPNFLNKVGIIPSNQSIIFEINDGLFGEDLDFKNVRKAIIENATIIFHPEVAKVISKIKI